MNKKTQERIVNILENMYDNSILFEEEHNTDHSVKHPFMCGVLRTEIKTLAKIIKDEAYDMLHVLED